MRKIVFVLMALLTLSACQESIEEHAARDAEETTMKRCPLRLNDEGTIILERITFDKATHVWCQYYLLETTPELLQSIDYRGLLLQELKNMPSYKPYMDNNFIFQYVFCDMHSPKDTLLNISLTPKDYRN